MGEGTRGGAVRLASPGPASAASRWRGLPIRVAASTSERATPSWKAAA